MIRLAQVSYSYPQQPPLLSRCSLELGQGLNLIVGPNGLGKSTLVQIAAGVLLPSEGSVQIDGFDLWKDEVAARMKLSYAPEHPDLTPFASLAQVADLVSSLRQVDQREGVSALELVGLGEHSDRTIKELSWGQKRRAHLAYLAIGNATNLILDEPLEALDQKTRAWLIRWIADRRDDGCSIVIVSHQIEPFRELTDTVVWHDHEAWRTATCKTQKERAAIEHLAAQGDNSWRSVEPSGGAGGGS